MTMRHSAIVLWSSALLLFLAVADARAEFDYVSGWDGQLFPSYIVSTATMRLNDDDAASDASDEAGQEAAEQEAAPNDGEESQTPEDLTEPEEGEAPEAIDEEHVLGDPETMRLLGVVVMAEEDNTPIEVEIEAPGVLEVSRWSGVLESANTEYMIFPPLKFNFKALIGNTQSVPLAVTYRVWLGDAPVEENTVNTTLRSINDCPTVVIHSEDEIENISYMFAAYVNEQHPFIDKVLRTSLNSGVVNTFDGYQSGEVENVLRQVYAIWDALSRRDVRYSNITATAAANRMVRSQHVRFIDQSINNAQANCVDGSALLASMLKKIEIETALVLMPGHCYLAFALDPEGKRWMGLETTLIGAKNVDVPPDAESDKIVGTKFEKKTSWLTFRLALAIGNKNLADQMPKFEETGTLESLAYQFISVSKARRKGILPIAFDTKERLNSANKRSN